jgi:hypothetical protein
VRGEAYVLVMLKALSARGSLFLFIRTHHHLEYYFNVSNIHVAANEKRPGVSKANGEAKVVEIRAARRAGLERPQAV